MDGYIKGKVLGRGTFGTIYLAKDKFTGKLCCLKEIFPQKITHPLIVMTRGIGTPSSMAPEIVKEEDYSFAVEVWGLGCILYELMALKRPFPFINLLILPNQIVAINPLPIIGSFSSDLIRVVM